MRLCHSRRMTSQAPSSDREPTARITIRRQSTDDVGYREVYVFFDDQQIAILQYGQSVTRQVPVGDHQVRAHNTLFRRIHHVTLEAGDHVYFTAINRPGWGMVAWLAVIGVGPVALTFTQDQAPSQQGA